MSKENDEQNNNEIVETRISGNDKNTLKQNFHLLQNMLLVLLIYVLCLKFHLVTLIIFLYMYMYLFSLQGI